MATLHDLNKNIEEKHQTLERIYSEAGSDFDMSKVKSLDGDTFAKIDRLKQMHAEINDLGKERDGLVALQGQKSSMDSYRREMEKPASAMVHPSDGAPQQKGMDVSRKSLGEMFIESKSFTNLNNEMKSGPATTFNVSLKTLMTTAAGWEPEVTRTGRFVELVLPPIQMMDLIPTTTTDQVAVSYMVETLATNAAAEVAEGALKPESALAVAPALSPVELIATILPVTNIQLRDVPRVRDYINNRLGYFVRKRLDTQILLGNGTTPNLRGILNTTGTQTHTAAANTPAGHLDAIFRAFRLIRENAGGAATAVVMNPADWEGIRLMKDATSGAYLWGHPAEPGPDRIFGVPVAQVQEMTAGAMLVGDFRIGAELAMREGLTMAVTDSHSDYFARNITVIRAELAAALVVYRPAAFVELDLTPA